MKINTLIKIIKLSCWSGLFTARKAAPVEQATDFQCHFEKREADSYT